MNAVGAALAHTQVTDIAQQHPWIERSLYPFASRFCMQDGYRLHYLDEGEGSPVLFVHGTPSWSFEWRAQIEALRAQHRCIAPDHLGFGLSDKPAEAPYGPADHAQRLLRLVEALDLRDITLVVHDFGGPIGLWVALQAPERVRQVVMVNTWMWSLQGDQTVRKISRFVASPLGRFLYLWLNASPRWLLPAAFGDRKRLTPRAHRHYLMPFAAGRAQRLGPWHLGRALWEASAFYAALWERRAELPKVTGLIWGLADPTFGERDVSRLQRAFPAAALHGLSGVGHFPQEEAPEQVTAALHTLLRQEPTRAAATD